VWWEVPPADESPRWKFWRRASLRAS
jgi:hypothetical protein